jgi:hypothetical protein
MRNLNVEQDDRRKTFSWAVASAFHTNGNELFPCFILGIDHAESSPPPPPKKGGKTNYSPFLFLSSLMFAPMF